MNKQRIGLLAGILLAGLAAPSAQAIDVTSGKWTLSFDGNVNAHYIYDNCESNPAVVEGGLACVGSGSSSAVSNGLLPAALSVSGATNQDGYDIGFTFGLYPGISTNTGGNPNGPSGFGHTALGTAGLDIRQVFLTVGTKSMGTIMAGRNIGLFAADAILNDMTLLGVGAGAGNYAAPGNTSLGSIGLGYIYTDWLAQINYTTPDMSGFKVTVGIFDPLNTLGQLPVNHHTPGFQAKIAYTIGSVYLSASGLTQKQRLDCADAPLAPCTGTAHVEYNSTAFDFGGKWDLGGLEVMGWYYVGNGVGTTGLFVDSNDAAGHARHSDGFLAQVTYKIGPTKVGLNYGQSKLDTAGADAVTPIPDTTLVLSQGLVHKNDKWTAGVYHNLTDNLLLVGEYSRVEDENQAGSKDNSWNLNAGFFLKF